MKMIPTLFMLGVACLPISLNAAPLNKFGSMQQQMAVPQMQQTVLPPPIQQAVIPERPALPAQAAPTIKKEKHNAVLNEVEKLLARLPLEKLQQWQSKFEEKRKKAEQSGKTKVVEYYDHLIALCKKLEKERTEP
jgi:cyclopropane fatty-acyl-phospholipid synthase-like methyltransferase